MTAPSQSAAIRERIVFLHGSLGGAPGAFSAQSDLAAEFDLSIPPRRGYALTDMAYDAVDHDGDAADIAALSVGGAHLVGTSTGSVIAMMAAARRPMHIRSLTLIEPPLFSLAADLEEVRVAIEALATHWGRGAALDERGFMAGFLNALQMKRRVPDQIDPALARGIAMLRTERLWDLEAPVDVVADAGIPVMIVSGGWSPIYDAVCARLADRLSAKLHCLPGYGHAVQTAGPGFNELLAAHVRAASGESTQENENACHDR